MSTDRNQLVARLAAGDEDAWRSFVETYGGLIFAVATRLGLRGADRDDLFQDACVTVMQSIHTLRDPTRLASWLYRVTYRLGIDALRSRRPEVGVEELTSSATGQLEPGFAEDLERLEEVSRLLDALGRLDSRCRNLLKLLYLEDPTPSYEEIARRLDMPIGSIGPTRARCLEKAARWLR